MILKGAGDYKPRYICRYYPYWTDKGLRLKNPKCDADSKKIMDLKSANKAACRDAAARHFFERVNAALVPDVEIHMTCIPSHDPSNHGKSGIYSLISMLAQACTSRVDASNALVRHTFVQEKHSGGAREIDVELKSLGLTNPNIFKKKFVLLLDDITTTGNSFSASTHLIMEAGAIAVQPLAIGYTER